ncbi:lysophospholipid acyltransferase family protein [Hydrogenoanaerobacterium sp.]|uniref:lysophospholipid acyltransferase family protein n=1 Tax=Hydrogenoanaerobacterium sp. TaxID=2953763 RepID=UPI0028A17702|nr:lysophospholipid acyltransferase family protein [Hydrogenoanaerobacterium sp.]
MRTIAWFIYFWTYLVFLIPKMRKVERLDAEGRAAERDAIVQREVRNWANALLRCAGVRVHVSGLENIPDETAVFVSNHQGNFDIPILLTALPHANGLVAKQELKKLPLIRTWMKHLTCVFIDRQNPRQSVAALGAAADNVRNGYSVIVFPEGTRSKGDKIGEFKSGAFKIALKTKAPIIPVCIDGSYKVMEANGNWIRPAEVNVKILPPVFTEGLSKEDAKDLPEQVRSLIVSNK